VISRLRPAPKRPAFRVSASSLSNSYCKAIVGVFKIRIVLRMRPTKVVLLVSALIGGAMTADAGIPIELARQRFANSKAINLDLEAQTQMATGDLRAAARTIGEALRRSYVVADILYAREVVRVAAQVRIGHSGL